MVEREEERKKEERRNEWKNGSWHDCCSAAKWHNKCSTFSWHTSCVRVRTFFLPRERGIDNAFAILSLGGVGDDEENLMQLGIAWDCCGLQLLFVKLMHVGSLTSYRGSCTCRAFVIRRSPVKLFDIRCTSGARHALVIPPLQGVSAQSRHHPRRARVQRKSVVRLPVCAMHTLAFAVS